MTPAARTSPSTSAAPAGLFTPARWLLGRMLRIIAWLLALLLLVMFVLAIPMIGRFDGELGFSLWEAFAGSGPSWFLFGMGTMCITYLPVLVGQGVTRKRFAEATALALVGGAFVLAVGVVVGYALEASAYVRMGWPLERNFSHLFEHPRQVHLVLLEYVPRILLYGLTGLLTAYAYVRLGPWWGTLLLPVTVAAPIILGTLVSLRPSEWHLAWTGQAWTGQASSSLTGVLLSLFFQVGLFLICRALLGRLPIRIRA